MLLSKILKFYLLLKKHFHVSFNSLDEYCKILPQDSSLPPVILFFTEPTITHRNFRSKTKRQLD